MPKQRNEVGIRRHASDSKNHNLFVLGNVKSIPFDIREKIDFLSVDLPINVVIHDILSLDVGTINDSLRGQCLIA